MGILELSERVLDRNVTLITPWWPENPDDGSASFSKRTSIGLLAQNSHAVSFLKLLSKRTQLERNAYHSIMGVVAVKARI